VTPRAIERPYYFVGDRLWARLRLVDLFDVALIGCDVCGKPLPEGRIQRRAEGGVCSYLCQRIDQRARIYGITGRLYRSIIERQNGLCAICGRSLLDEAGWNLEIDHDHRTGVVRGLLCARCNVGLGFFQDDPDRLVRAADYIRRSPDAAAAVEGSRATSEQ